MKTIPVSGASIEVKIPVYVAEDSWGNPITAEERNALEARAELAANLD